MVLNSISPWEQLLCGFLRLSVIEAINVEGLVNAVQELATSAAITNKGDIIKPQSVNGQLKHLIIVEGTMLLNMRSVEIGEDEDRVS